MLYFYFSVMLEMNRHIPFVSEKKSSQVWHFKLNVFARKICIHVNITFLRFRQSHLAFSLHTFWGDRKAINTSWLLLHFSHRFSLRFTFCLLSKSTNLCRRAERSFFSHNNSSHSHVRVWSIYKNNDHLSQPFLLIFQSTSKYFRRVWFVPRNSAR